MKRLLKVLALALSFTLLAAGCGDDDSDPSTAPGFDGTTIKIGVVNDFTGPVAIIGNPLHKGSMTFYDWTNAQGGIAGKYQIEVVEGDSTYNPTVALQVYNEIKDDVAMIGNLLGTPIVNAALETLAADGLLAIPASLDAAWVRQPNLVPLGAPYQVQAINGIDWWINEGADPWTKSTAASSRTIRTARPASRAWTSSPRHWGSPSPTPRDTSRATRTSVPRSSSCRVRVVRSCGSRRHRR